MDNMKMKLIEELIEHLSELQGKDFKSSHDEMMKPKAKEIDIEIEGDPMKEMGMDGGEKEPDGDEEAGSEFGKAPGSHGKAGHEKGEGKELSDEEIEELLKGLK